MNDITVTNPGLVNVADQADGLTVVDQEILVTSPSTNSGPTVEVANQATPSDVVGRS